MALAGQELEPIGWQTLGAQVPSRGNAVSRWCGRALLKCCGWSLSGEVPDRPQLIIAVAPHTSNFDFILTVGVILGLGMDARFLAKRSLFFFPLGILMRGFGGIPIDRDGAGGVVEQMRARFAASPKMILGIAPEGTRSKVERWRSGFALIAKTANVPVLPAVVDYPSKVVTFAPLIENVSDAEQTVLAVQRAAAAGRGRR